MQDKPRSNNKIQFSTMARLILSQLEIFAIQLFSGMRLPERVSNCPIRISFVSTPADTENHCVKFNQSWENRSFKLTARTI